jgi:hypothetical protein
MIDGKAYLLLFDGFADWEASLAAAEINKSQRYRVVTVGLAKAPVESMGGLRVMPEITSGEMDLERDLLIAAIALANDLTVVTGNTREFRRVPGLHVEDWEE